MEVLACPKDIRRKVWNPLHDKLQSFREMVRRWIACTGICRQCKASGNARPPRSQCPAWRWHQHRGQERRRWDRLFRPQTPEGRKNPGDHRQQRIRAGACSCRTSQQSRYGAPARGAECVEAHGQTHGSEPRDSRHNRKAIFNAGLVPNIKENPRNRKAPKRGRKRLFNAAVHSLRLRVERTFAWEDKFKRLLLRFEFIQQRHYGMKLMAYTLVNLRHFWVPRYSSWVVTILR